jgi:hypothetical protein
MSLLLLSSLMALDGTVADSTSAADQVLAVVAFAATLTEVASATDQPEVLISVQTAAPAADVTISDWETHTGATTNLFAQINEAVASDAEYIRTTLSPITAIYVTQLDPLEVPLNRANHRLQYRIRKDQPAGQSLDLTIQLRHAYVNEGTPGMLIHEVLADLSGAAWIDGEFTLTPEEATLITDYETGLFLRLVGTTA